MENEWVNEKKSVNEKMNEWLNEWMVEWMYQWTNQRVRLIDNFFFSNQIENVNLDESQLAWYDENASRARQQQKQRARQ